ncbi:Yap1801p [Saccharomyces cerevisiae x Saccharomyces kudriavzevii VIN7]|uniref:Yap1801p n=1 Tax=Saccharomyces cerevisiae x Saccharomyces kudriavzevii (strain VIN7) TaxID=1095631 RepID=H0GVZ1_SACCK|nr:Yap1801p [Saccharomyces cerevisiae x Saccharomyces kudriavzevii VIN7]
MTTYFKLVKGATKIKSAPPKQKYLDPILLATGSEEDFYEIVKALDSRVNDTAWTIVYKSLLVVHLMMREGKKDVALRYYSRNLEFFSIENIRGSSGSASGDMRALDRYDSYLKVRSREFGKIKKDYVRDGYRTLKLNTNNYGNSKNKQHSINIALDHVESLEVQIQALVKNKYTQFDLSNELVIFGFKLLIQDLLALYNALNEGIITLLESFFELSHQNAERTLDLYKTFVDLTEHVVRYLKNGKTAGLKIPVIKHITTKLVRSLEEHLIEDDKTHSTFVPIDGSQGGAGATASRSIAQERLEQIREQKRILEAQLKNEQVPISPAVTTATTAQSYNPFGADSSAHTNIPIAGANQPQQTPNNPFVTQMQPQGVVPQAARTEPVTFNAPQYAMVQPVANTSPVQEPGVSAQLTGYYSINNHLTPTFTGAGFGGYSVSQGTTSGFDQQVAQSQTGSNNPFALRNPATIATGNPTQEPILNNPFSEPNFNEQNAGLPPQQQVISNPFQNQTHLQQQQKVLSSTINSVMTTPTSMQGSTNVQRFDNVQFPAPYTQNLPQQLQQQQGSYAPATAAVTPIVNTTGIVQPQTIPFYPQQQQQSQTQHQGLGDRYTNGNFNLIDM